MTRQLAPLLYAERDERKLRMAGQETYRHAVAQMTEASTKSARATGTRSRRHRLLRPAPGERADHHGVADALGVPHERVSFNVEWTATRPRHRSRSRSRELSATG